MLNIYRASAGSGKTHRLTGDYIDLLFSRDNEYTYRKILAVTFTNKATDEMKSRIVKELHMLSTGMQSDYREGLMSKHKLTPDAVNHKARKILIAILHDYSSFSISTIDKFFQQVIRAFAREIGVQGGYNLELDSDTTLQQSIDNLFLDLNKSENKQLLTWLTNFAEERIEQSENWNPRKNIESLGQEIFKENYQNKAEETNKKLHDREFLAAYRAKLRKTQSDFDTEIKSLSHKTLKLIADAGLTVESFKGGSRSPMTHLVKFVKGNYELKDSFIALSERAENCYAKSTPKNIIASIDSIYYNGLQQNLIAIIELLTNDIVYYNSAGIILKYINTLGILSDLAIQIKKLTDEQNTMLISDTNMLLNRIIDNSDTPFVYEKTGINIDHFMIDEFQDTSFLQWKNFLPLINNSLGSDNFNLVVGDVKQSIYRWRNSDWKLLDETVLFDFRPEQRKEINLDTNWRSDKNIIEFNNSFFKSAAVLLQQKLNNTIEPVLGVYPEMKKHMHRILHAYGHLQQKKSNRAKEGYVNFSFIDADENDDGWKNESMKRLPVLLENLQQRGYMPGDVAILVKKNDDAREVIHTLLSYKTSENAKKEFSYNVMGSEGLLIASAAAVRFIINILKLIINPNDSICKTIVSYEYARAYLKLPNNQALQACFVTEQNATNAFSPLFSSEQSDALGKIKNASIYDLVEKIISLFNLGNWYNETAFVQGFQDIVYKFTSNKNTDIYSFVKWWDTIGFKQSISTPENQNAFRVMTIHKSKGLDFKVVIIPFCDWELSKKTGNLKNILWTEPNKEPFNELPLIPVEYSSKLAQSIFAPQYFDELMHQYIDNLNVAYVAFTRAKHELYCISPKPKKDPESEDKINSISSLLHYSFTNGIENSFENNDIGSYNPEFNIFEAGKAGESESKTTNIDNKTSLISYSSESPTGRLKLRNLSTDVWLDSQTITDSKLNLGTIMHEILQSIVIKEDAENAILKFEREGRINTNETKIIKQLLNDFWELPETNEWFSDQNKVLNEAVIICPGAKLYRPDRVVINKNEATVIDYKFGSTEKESYINQVRNYVKLISEMGYKTTGYVCYVMSGKIIKVN